MARRKDATRVKFEEPFHSIVPYIMPKRAEAEVFIRETFDVTDLMEYIKKYNLENDAKLKFFHCFCYAIAKTIYHRPQMNYFIKGKYYWKRNDISLSFVAKQQFADGAEEKLMFMVVKPEMTVKEISNIILGDVKKARETNSNDLDKLMHVIGIMPRFLISFIVGFAQTLDFFGIMPSFLMKGDPNYSTALISNLGSIGSGAPYHHLSNYGTNSIMITIGTIKEVDGRQKVDIGFTIDERIADGFYFVKSLRYVKYALEHPDTLMEKIEDKFPEGVI